MDPKMKRYPLAVALAMIGLPQSTATNWSRRGHAGLFVEPSGRGRGYTRQLSADMILRLALTKAVVDLCIVPQKAALMVDQALLVMQEREVTTMTHYLFAEGAQVVFNDDQPASLPSGPPYAVFKLNVSVVAERVRLVLAELDQTPDHSCAPQTPR
jgi:hypothetical protein